MLQLFRLSVCVKNTCNQHIFPKGNTRDICENLKFHDFLIKLSFSTTFPGLDFIFSFFMVFHDHGNPVLIWWKKMAVMTRIFIRTFWKIDAVWKSILLWSIMNIECIGYLTLWGICHLFELGAHTSNASWAALKLSGWKGPNLTKKYERRQAWPGSLSKLSEK